MNNTNNNTLGVSNSNNNGLAPLQLPRTPKASRSPSAASMQQQSQPPLGTAAEASGTPATADIIEVQSRMLAYERQLNELKIQVMHLSKEVELREKQKSDAAKYFQSEIESLKRTIEKMREDHALADSRKTSHTSFLESKFQGSLSELQTLNQQKDARIRTLEEELDSYHHYRDQRARLEETVASLQQQLLTEQESSQKRMAELEIRLATAQEKFDEDLSYERASRNLYIKKRITKLLDQETLHIVEENQALRTEISYMKDIVDKSKHQKETLDTKCKQLMRELGIAEQTIEDISKKSIDAQRDVKELRTRVSGLEDVLTRQVHEHEAEMRQMRHEASKREDSLMEELRRVRHALEMKKKEAQQVRMLGQQVLEERSEVEKFFLQALEEVREAKRREREASLAPQESLFNTRGHKKASAGLRALFLDDFSRHNSPTPLFPALGGTLTQDDSGTSSPYKLEIQDMTWEDKERVLRVLFTKINAQNAQPTAATSSPEKSGSSAAKKRSGSRKLTPEPGASPVPVTDGAEE